VFRRAASFSVTPAILIITGLLLLGFPSLSSFLVGVSIASLLLDGLVTDWIMSTGGMELNPFLMSLMKCLGYRHALVASRVIGCIMATALMLSAQTWLLYVFAGSVLSGALVSSISAFHKRL